MQWILLYSNADRFNISECELSSIFMITKKFYFSYTSLCRQDFPRLMDIKSPHAGDIKTLLIIKENSVRQAKSAR